MFIYDFVIQSNARIIAQTRHGRGHGKVTAWSPRGHGTDEVWQTDQSARGKKKQSKILETITVAARHVLGTNFSQSLEICSSTTTLIPNTTARAQLFSCTRRPQWSWLPQEGAICSIFTCWAWRSEVHWRWRTHKKRVNAVVLCVCIWCQISLIPLFWQSPQAAWLHTARACVSYSFNMLKAGSIKQPEVNTCLLFFRLVIQSLVVPILPGYTRDCWKRTMSSSSRRSVKCLPGFPNER